MKVKLKPKTVAVVKKHQGTVTLLSAVERKTHGHTETVKKSGSVENIKPAIDFPANAPRVSAEVGLKLVSGYNSCWVAATVELPVAGFTKELLAKTHERAFQIAEDKVLKRMDSIKPILEKL